MDDDNDGDSAIQGALTAIKRGERILKRIRRISTVEYAEGIIEAAQGLEDMLHENEIRISDFYAQSRSVIGQPFISALNVDFVVINRILVRTNNLMNQFMGLQLCFDEPADLELEYILTLKGESERACKVILDLLAKTRQNLLPIDFEEPKGAAQHENVRSNSIDSSQIVSKPGGSAPERKGITTAATWSGEPTQISPLTSRRDDLRRMASPARPKPVILPDLGFATSAGQITRKSRVTSKELSSKRDSAISGAANIEWREPPQSPTFITTEEIESHAKAIEDFLLKRLKSRQAFQKQIRTRQSGTEHMTEIFNAIHGSTFSIATTLSLPGFGNDVEPGIEAVKRVPPDAEGLIPLKNETPRSSRTSSASSNSYIGNDSSFSKYGGFCEGAKRMLRGDKNYYEIVQRPVGGGPSFVVKKALEDIPYVTRMGPYNAEVVIRCAKCAYEVDLRTFKKDRGLENSTIHNSTEHGIRYRTSFLSKFHLSTKSADDPIYACVYCGEERRPIEDHDATVFFSAAQLMRHLSKHTRPLREIPGLKVCYGSSSGPDFDLNFVRTEVKPNALSNINTATANLPTARAVLTNRTKASKGIPKDPDGKPILQFAVGAHIVGITFPERFCGQWGLGNEFSIKQKPHLTGVARWDHKPKDSSAEWLAFSKNEKIEQIRFPDVDHWCYSGRNGRGKTGLFPRAWVVDVGIEKAVRSETGASRMSFIRGLRRSES